MKPVPLPTIEELEVLLVKVPAVDAADKNSSSLNNDGFSTMRRSSKRGLKRTDSMFPADFKDLLDASLAELESCEPKNNNK